MKTIIGSSSPTFVATFADGTITRMTTNCPKGKLDLGLGVRLSRAAYESRRSPPAFTAGHFETPSNGDGCAAVMLRACTADKLDGAWKLARMTY
jgi:hypothetical protein